MREHRSQSSSGGTALGFGRLFMQALDLSRYRRRQRDDALGAEDGGMGPLDQPCATVLRAPRIRRLARKDVNGLRFQVKQLRRNR